MKPVSTHGNGGLGLYISSNSRMNLLAVSAGGSCRLEVWEFRVRRFRKALEIKLGNKKEKGDRTVLKSRKRMLKGVKRAESKKGGR